MNRLLLFSHFNPQQELAAHILFTLEKIRPFFSRMVFVSGSELQGRDMDQVHRFCDKILIRENSGADFGAWREAFMEEGWNELKAYDQVTLMNDNCFGPIVEMHQVFEKMEKPGIDFWGLTSYRGSGFSFRKIGSYARSHVQCHFICFSNKVVDSSTFLKFWEKSSFSKYKIDRTVKYEYKLTRTLSASGFQHKVLLDTESLMDKKEDDFAVWYPDVLIHHGIPFIRIDAFLKFHHPSYLKRLIEKYSDYPVHLIDDHISATYPPDVSIKIVDKKLFPPAPEETLKTKARIAIHLHVFYNDVFEKILKRLDDTGLSYDLYISTDRVEKKEKALKSIQEKHMEPCLQEIIIFENRGRDILPWLNMADKLGKYEIAGHFHTKKTIWTDEWIGESWMEDMMRTLIDPAPEIIEYLNTHPGIGIVIPDIPHCHKVISEVDTWDGNREIFHSLWKRLSLKKTLNINEIYTPIMPYGNMFWYRPESLKPLFDLNLSMHDFPAEPLPDHDTVPHAIERLPVYIAWGQGYDFRIAMNITDACSGFDFKAGNERLGRIYQSLTWRICSKIAFLPGKIVYRLKNL